jgi:hypothetical protein
MLKQNVVGLRNVQIVSVHPGMPRRNALDLKIEVKLYDRDDLFKTEEAMEWLLVRGYKDEEDWDINLRNGMSRYTSFYFKDQELATEFTLVFG